MAEQGWKSVLVDISINNYYYDFVDNDLEIYNNYTIIKIITEMHWLVVFIDLLQLRNSLSNQLLQFMRDIASNLYCMHCLYFLSNLPENWP